MDERRAGFESDIRAAPYSAPSRPDVVALMRMIVLDYLNVMITATWSAEYNPSDSSMKDAIGE